MLFVEAASNFARQTESASRCVNERYVIAPKITSKSNFDTRDLTNLSTSKSPMMLPAKVPSPIFFAVSESSENKSIHLVWQDYD